MNTVARALRDGGPVQSGLQVAALKALGTAVFALGAVGLVLPLVPTTELWMAAAYCYAKSAPELAERLFAHPGIGPALRNWIEHGVVNRKVKLMAIGGLSTNFATGVWIADLSGGALMAWGAILFTIGAYMATRRAQTG